MMPNVALDGYVWMPAAWIVERMQTVGLISNATAIDASICLIHVMPRRRAERMIYSQVCLDRYAI